MLPEGGPKFAEVTSTTQKLDQACCVVLLLIVNTMILTIFIHKY
jgi:hypothetical protein